MSNPKDTQIGGSHYKDMAIQPIDFILGNDLGFVEGNIVKYICRWDKKNGIEDLKKIRHYVDILIERQQELTEEALTKLTRIRQNMERDDTTNS